MPMSPPGRHATVALAPPAVSQIARLAEEFCASAGVPDDIAWRLKVVLDEIVANIVSHGNPADQNGTIDVWFMRAADVVEVRIADDGLPFDPLERPDPDLQAPLEARQPGGLGIVLVKGLMDEVHYERTTRNILILRKRIEPAASPGGAGPR